MDCADYDFKSVQSKRKKQETYSIVATIRNTGRKIKVKFPFLISNQAQFKTGHLFSMRSGA